MDNTQTAKQALRDVLDIAIEAGRAERERLGRDLTEAEAGALADMVQRQLRLALAVLR